MVGHQNMIWTVMLRIVVLVGRDLVGKFRSSRGNGWHQNLQWRAGQCHFPEYGIK